MSTQNQNRVASCAPLATQPATLDRNTATSGATTNATAWLKAKANAVIRRNRPATDTQPTNENSATLHHQKQGSELRTNIRTNERWLQFVDMAVQFGADSADVNSEFTDTDIADLITEPDSKLPLHARTIADAIKREGR